MNFSSPTQLSNIKCRTERRGNVHRELWIQRSELRNNQNRNQIDKIIVKNKHRNLLTNLGSYSGITTYTDHRLVKANLKMKWEKKSNTTIPKTTTITSTCNIYKIQFADNSTAKRLPHYLKRGEHQNQRRKKLHKMHGRISNKHV